MGKYAKIFLSCFFVFSSLFFFTNFHSLFPHSILLFSPHLSLCVCVVHCNSIRKKLFKYENSHVEVIPASPCRGENLQNNESSCTYQGNVMDTSLMTQPNGKKQVRVHSNREEPPHPWQTSGYPRGHNSYIVLSCLSQCLPETSDKIFMPESLCHGPVFCLYHNISCLLHNSPLFHSSISFLCWWHWIGTIVEEKLILVGHEV